MTLFIPKMEEMLAFTIRCWHEFRCFSFLKRHISGNHHNTALRIPTAVKVALAPVTHSVCVAFDSERGGPTGLCS